jgi:hypothetical protein
VIYLTEKESEEQADEKIFVGDEYAEDDEQVEEPTNELEGLYDLLLPPGIPESIIVELVEEFDLEATMRVVKSSDEKGGIGEREVLVLRGDQDSVNNAHDYMINRMRNISEDFKSPWVKY